jgi:hypothetical protein
MANRGGAANKLERAPASRPLLDALQQLRAMLGSGAMPRFWSRASPSLPRLWVRVLSDICVVALAHFMR